MIRLVSGINSLFLSTNSIPISLTHLSLHLSLLPLLTHHSPHPELSHSFSPGINLPLSQILHAIDSFPSSELTLRSLDRAFSSEHICCCF